MNNPKRRPQPTYEQIPELQISLINLPKLQNFQYYHEQNLIVLTDFKHFQVLFYKVNGSDIEMIEELTQQFNKNLESKFNTIIYLQNSILVDLYDHVIKIDIEDLNKYNILQDNILPKFYYTAFQVNRKCFARSTLNDRLIIYQIKNIKISHTILKKPKISSTQFYKYIIQATTRKHLYCYNIQMTKQIRKFSIRKINEPIFNSNCLFVPIIENEIITHLQVYDICSMKVKSILSTKYYQMLFGYKNCIFIEDFNVVAILYVYKLDVVDLDTFQCIRSQKIGYGFTIFMEYDKKQGLMIFQQK